MRSKKLRLMTLTAVLAALVFAATILIRIPAPPRGYVNLGDCLVNVSGWLLGPAYGFAAAGIGSAFSDICAGYVIYAPVTFVLKGSMAALAYAVYKSASRKLKTFPARIAAAVSAELLMVIGYYLFESLIYGSLYTPLIGVAANIVQGGMGAAGSALLYETILKKLPKIV